MVNINRSALILALVWGGGVILNKGFPIYNNFIYILILLVLWLLMHTIVERRCSHISELLTLLTTCLAVAIIIAIKTKSLFKFYVFFELRVVPITLILFFYGYQPEKLQATLFLLLYTVVGRLPLLLYIISDSDGYHRTLLLTLPITVGFIIKSPIYLMHIWLPKAHVEAPVGGSMILAGVLLKLGSYGLLLFLPQIKLNRLLIFYLGISLLGSTVGALICLRQGDIKLLIAYSSVVHIGVVLIGFLGGTELGYTCGLLMVTAHGLTSPFLFSIAYWFYGSSHSRLFVNNTLAWPIISGLLAGLVSLNINVPPRLRLWSEVLMAMRTFNFINYAALVLLAIFFLGAAYNLYFYTVCIHSRFPNKQMYIRSARIMGVLQVIVLSYFSFLCLDLFHLYQIYNN